MAALGELDASGGSSLLDAADVPSIMDEYIQLKLTLAELQSDLLEERAKNVRLSNELNVARSEGVNSSNECHRLKVENRELERKNAQLVRRLAVAKHGGGGNGSRPRRTKSADGLNLLVAAAADSFAGRQGHDPRRRRPSAPGPLGDDEGSRGSDADDSGRQDRRGSDATSGRGPSGGASRASAWERPELDWGSVSSDGLEGVMESQKRRVEGAMRLVEEERRRKEREEEEAEEEESRKREEKAGATKRSPRLVRRASSAMDHLGASLQNRGPRGAGHGPNGGNGGRGFGGSRRASSVAILGGSFQGGLKSNNGGRRASALDQLGASLNLGQMGGWWNPGRTCSAQSDAANNNGGGSPVDDADRGGHVEITHREISGGDGRDGRAARRSKSDTLHVDDDDEEYEEFPKNRVRRSRSSANFLRRSKSSRDASPTSPLRRSKRSGDGAMDDSRHELPRGEGRKDRRNKSDAHSPPQDDGDGEDQGEDFPREINFRRSSTTSDDDAPAAKSLRRSRRSGDGSASRSRTKASSLRRSKRSGDGNTSASRARTGRSGRAGGEDADDASVPSVVQFVDELDVRCSLLSFDGRRVKNE